MLCVVCREKIKTNIDAHVDLHLSIRQDQILEYFKNLAAPFKVRLYPVTGADVQRREVLFSMENAKLFIGYAERHHQIPWQECCEWMAFHEKAHIRLSDLYSRPGINPHIVSNVEDYYIEQYMMLKKYRRVYEANAKLILEIRKMMQLPMTINLANIDSRIYYYLTYACWYASEVASLTEVNLTQPELKIIETVAGVIKGLKTPEGLSPTISRINVLLACLIGSHA